MAAVDFEKIRKLIKDKKIIAIGFSIFILVTLIVGLFLCKKEKEEDKLLNGVISVNDNETEIQEDLFLFFRNKYLIEVDAFNYLSLQYFENNNSIIIRDERHQFEANLDKNSFKVDLVEIEDDGNYEKPTVINDKRYVDTDYVFDTFGYTSEYQLSSDKKTLKLILKQKPDNVYEVIRLTEPKEKEPETEKVSLAEDSYISNNDKLQRPGEELPTVPLPEETIEASEEANESLEEAVENIEDSSSNNAVETTEASKESEAATKPQEAETIVTAISDGRVNRTPNLPNRKTDEEFKAIWNNEKNAIISIFSSGTPNGQNKACDIRNDTMVAFNPSHGGVYYDTICVSSDTLSGLFILAEFSSDWSDLANNTVSEESKSYYNGIPATYAATLNTLLGVEEGTKLFNYIKENADKTITGGFIYSYDSNGNLKSEYSDTKVEGDGIMASEIDFTDWQNRTTSDGLRYSVSRMGDGFRIEIYKS